MNQTQNIIADLIKKSSFNNFDGNACVKCLERHEDLWQGFVWGRFGNYSPLITLRDIDADLYNADTLYILPKPGKEDELKSAIQSELDPDELTWEDSNEANSKLGSYGGPYNPKVLLRAWWD